MTLSRFIILDKDTGLVDLIFDKKHFPRKNGHTVRESNKIKNSKHIRAEYNYLAYRCAREGNPVYAALGTPIYEPELKELIPITTIQEVIVPKSIRSALANIEEKEGLREDLLLEIARDAMAYYDKGNLLARNVLAMRFKQSDDYKRNIHTSMAVLVPIEVEEYGTLCLELHGVKERKPCCDNVILGRTADVLLSYSNDPRRMEKRHVDRAWTILKEFHSYKLISAKKDNLFQKLDFI